jgi:BCD family chlorophyll transporter-like MFS transporter
VRLGLVQTCLGAIIVLTTSTLNRIMVVELALPAMLPGFLSRCTTRCRCHGRASATARMSAVAPRAGLSAACWCSPCGVIGALGHRGWPRTSPRALPCALRASFAAIGLGAGAAGTSLLVTLAKHVAPQRKAAAATIVWIMMIAGFAVTAGHGRALSRPLHPLRLVQVTAVVCAGAVVVTLLAVYRVEPRAAAAVKRTSRRRGHAESFARRCKQVWQEPRRGVHRVRVHFHARLQRPGPDPRAFRRHRVCHDAGAVHAAGGYAARGVLLGMLVVAVSTRLHAQPGPAVLRAWTVGGCLASAVALACIASGGLLAPHWPLPANVFLLGVANGAFAVAAIASMMTLASRGAARREGLRMGLWGAAQAIAFALGGFLGTVAIDVSRAFVHRTQRWPTAWCSRWRRRVCGRRIHRYAFAAARERRGEATPSFGDVAMAEVLDGR